ncbi:hypothetical protein [Endozoicomonas sp.]|uniref:hypothetical protein n=1 Tax=Endozoicomonas sp. TaxID=1892382 RepID=UPI002884601B|nr:hypothetical protein [Endozoicomonas sp.]
MHSQATRSNHDSFQRSQAIWLSYDLAERIKSNLDGMDEYQTTLATANVDLQNFCRLPPASWTTCTSSGNPCDSTAVARFDLFESMCGDSLISPDMAINCSGTCDSGDEVTITLSWDSRGAAAGALTERQQIELTFRRD